VNPVTSAGMPLRGMRLLVHRGQVLLLLVVGVLAGVAIVGACLELCGVPVLGPLRVNELFTQPTSPLPSRIVIGEGRAPVASPASTTAALDPPPVLSPAPPQASPTTAVVPATVYTYPPEGGGRDGRGRGGRGG
jgi:hypothetical protein